MASNPLRSCWYPVAYSASLGEEPLGATVLDEPVVIWRDSTGAASAMGDLCIHRGTPLSLGWVDGDAVVCAYHGWRYGQDGRCVAIPQLADPTRVPAKARVPSFLCQERYGMVWVALEEPRFPLPEVPELEDPSFRVVFNGPYAWECDASRQVENFTDLGHFAWVHPGLLGDPNRPVVDPHEVETREHVLHYTIVRPAAAPDEFTIVSPAQAREQLTQNSRYELHLPYTIAQRVNWGGHDTRVYFFSSQPISEGRCCGFLAVARNYELDQPDSVTQDFEDVIFGQDRRIAEAQRPERVPFDLSEELHLRFDAVAVAYRRAMRANDFAIA